MTWEAVIGLEVHVQLNTASKIFSGSATRFGAAANSQASLIDLGMPGTLPVVNAAAIRAALRFGLGIEAEIAERSVFARKNYFYPDLPKGYQISQMEEPIVGAGHLDIEGPEGSKRVRIIRAHLEEDAGKSLHTDFAGMTGIDLNRAGTPLLEIVSAPDLASAQEAVAYLRAIHGLIRYLDISDGNMAEGSMRCDCNVSVRHPGEELGTRCEIKNVNSFKFVEKAIQYEIQRQIDLLEDGGKVRQETRLYDAERNETRSMRSKEEANDYRYFPDPDLLPVHITAAMLADERARLPELPTAKKQRFMADYGLIAYDAAILVASRELADYFEAAVRASAGQAKPCANWIMGEVLAHLNREEMEITHCPVSPQQLGDLIRRIQDGTISGKIAKQLFSALWSGEGQDVDALIDSRGLRQESDAGLISALVDAVLADHPDTVAAYRSGKDKLFGFFVGEVMKRSRGKANPAQVNALLKEKLAPG